MLQLFIRISVSVCIIVVVLNQSTVNMRVVTHVISYYWMHVARSGQLAPYVVSVAVVTALGERRTSDIVGNVNVRIPSLFPSGVESTTYSQWPPNAPRSLRVSTQALRRK